MVNNLKTNDSYNPNSIIPKAINVYTPKMHFSYHYQKQRLQIEYDYRKAYAFDIVFSLIVIGIACSLNEVSWL